MLSNLRTEAMATEDDPRFSARFVLLGCMLHSKRAPTIAKVACARFGIWPGLSHVRKWRKLVCRFGLPQGMTVPEGASTSPMSCAETWRATGASDHEKLADQSTSP